MDIKIFEEIKRRCDGLKDSNIIYSVQFGNYENILIPEEIPCIFIDFEDIREDVLETPEIISEEIDFKLMVVFNKNQDENGNSYFYRIETINKILNALEKDKDNGIDLYFGQRDGTRFSISKIFSGSNIIFNIVFSLNTNGFLAGGR